MNSKYIKIRYIKNVGFHRNKFKKKKNQKFNPKLAILIFIIIIVLECINGYGYSHLEISRDMLIILCKYVYICELYAPFQLHPFILSNSFGHPLLVLKTCPPAEKGIKIIQNIETFAKRADRRPKITIFIYRTFSAVRPHLEIFDN